MGTAKILDRTGSDAPVQKRIAELWRSPRAAEYLGISPGHLRRLCMERVVPFLKPFGSKGRTLFDPEDLAQFVRASRVAPMR